MSSMSRATGLLLAALASCLLPLVASAQTPALINYQGRLVNGTNLVNGSVGLSLRLFDASSAGTMLYEDTGTVTVVDGLYATFIGDGTTSGSLTNALGSTNVFIEVAVNGSALSPRERLVSSAYAVISKRTELYSGAVLDSQLSSNVARLNGTNQTFVGAVSFNSASNSFVGSFSGNAGTLTNLQASSIVLSQRVAFAWGNNGSGQTNVPAGTPGAVAVAGGGSHGLALLPNGSVMAWGDNTYGQANVPANATGVVAIAAGSSHSLALRSDGVVVAWGAGGTDTGIVPHNGQCIVPAGATGVVAIACGAYHSLAVRSDGKAIAWGINHFDQAVVPAGTSNVIAAAAGVLHSMILKSDGHVTAWGDNGSGQTSVPATATGVVAIAAGSYHNLALRSDGTVIAWGDSGSGRTTVPANATGVVAIAAGDSHSLALRSDGRIVAWGDNGFGKANVPSNAVEVLAIGSCCSADHSLALRVDRSPAQVVLADRGNTFAGSVTAASFIGNGSQLTNLSAAAIGSGTLSDARLSTNIARLNSGTYPDARLSTNVALLNAGTYPDARLSTNVALLSSAQQYSAAQSIAAPPGQVALQIVGSRTGTIAAPLVFLSNTNTALPSAPTLRIVGYGNATDGVLSVSAQSSVGNIARFGNGSVWVGHIDASGNFSGLTFTPTSDRNAKENFAAVDPAEILEKVAALPLARWNYKADAGTVHIGPMAQDFHAAFDVGPDDKHIATVDADGVALAAIQALAKENAVLKKQNVEILERLRVLEQKRENVE